MLFSCSSKQDIWIFLYGSCSFAIFLLLWFNRWVKKISDRFPVENRATALDQSMSWSSMWSKWQTTGRRGLIKNELYCNNTSRMTCLEYILPNSERTKSTISIENGNSRAPCTVPFIFILSGGLMALLAWWFYRTGCKIYKDIVND